MNESASDSARGSADVSRARSTEPGDGAVAGLGGRAFRSPASWLRFLVPAVLGLSGDLLLKAWSFPPGEMGFPVGRYHAGVHAPEFDGRPKTLTIVPHFLDFITTVNEGAVFGKFQGHVGLFLAFSIVAMGIILWVFATSGRKQWVVHIALGLIAAGALGNMYDRAIYHGVRDMLQFSVNWYPYIFNLADVLLCLGVPLLIARWMFTKEPAKA